MFDSIVTKIAHAIRNTARAVTAAMRTPWLAPLSIVALILIW